MTLSPGSSNRHESKCLRRPRSRYTKHREVTVYNAVAVDQRHYLQEISHLLGQIICFEQCSDNVSECIWVSIRIFAVDNLFRGHFCEAVGIYQIGCLTNRKITAGNLLCNQFQNQCMTIHLGNNVVDISIIGWQQIRAMIMLKQAV